ncbi:ORF6N domain-containing protein [Clostridium baratii]|uniref:ORF6N domain-containing protein n=1 Tax=Clostridium baratii TaxID=1561 RepID=UPI0030D02054
MDNLILKEKQEFMGIKIPVIEGGFGEGQKVILAKTVAEIHQYENGEKSINLLITRNIERFDSNDLINLCNEDFKVSARNLGFITSNAQKQCYLLSQRGYTKLVAMMDNSNDKKWDVMNNLIDDYFNMREELKENKPTCIEDVLINSLQEMKAIKQKLNEANNNALEAKEKAEENKEEIQAMREAVVLDSNSWRKDTATLINKIASKLGGFEHIKLIREEAYNLLDNTYGVKLQSRLLNKQKKMALEGVPKYKVNKVNKLDVIADDKKLINGYINIIGKMAIKYGVGEV